MSDLNQFNSGEIVYHADTCSPLVKAQNEGKLELSAAGRYTYPGKKIPDGCLEEVCSLGCWDVHREQNWGLDWHRNEGIEITFLEKGSLYFATSNDEFELLPGYLTITRPWQKHTVGKPNVTSSLLHWIILDLGVRHPHSEWKWPDWFVLSQEDLNKITDLLRYNEEPVWRGNDEILNCFKKIKVALNDGDIKTHENRLKLYINELFLLIMEMMTNVTNKKDYYLTSGQRTVKLFIEELPELLGMDWSLEQMAEQCNLKRSQFSTYFTRITNHTPINFLTELRVKKAEELLMKTDLSISQIAIECGFSSGQYFAAQFRKKHNVNPAGFRHLEAAG